MTETIVGIVLFVLMTLWSIRDYRRNPQRTKKEWWHSLLTLVPFGIGVILLTQSEEPWKHGLGAALMLGALVATIRYHRQLDRQYPDS